MAHWFIFIVFLGGMTLMLTQAIENAYSFVDDLSSVEVSEEM